MSESGQTDRSTTIAELKQIVDDFVADRDWHQFHNPKNLVMSLSIEAAELMEHFQWLSPDESQNIIGDPDELRAIGEEVADCLAYLLAIGNSLELDLATVLKAKMVKNAQKYPLESSRGRPRPNPD